MQQQYSDPRLRQRVGDFSRGSTTSESAVKALTSWVRYPRPAGALSRVSRAANLTNGANLTMCFAQYWLLHQARPI